MHRINLKPISVNEAYRGRRFATPKLKQFKHDLAMMLPYLKVPAGRISVVYQFGVSSKQSDGDNLIKAFQDSVAERYGFNDKMIYEWHIKKVDVTKGNEYIEFSICPQSDV